MVLTMKLAALEMAPFGGVKKSSTDSFKEQGASAIDFYTRIKTVYLDYSA
jgi:aldehyde dehydrogenase (NAD+)